MGKRFRTFAEDLVTRIDKEDSYLDAVELLEHELEVYYDDVVKEHEVTTSGSTLLNSGTVGLANMKNMKKMREETAKKWDSLGFLEGLKGHVKPNIAELYECCASSRLNEVELTGKTDLEVYEKEGQLKK